MYVQKGETAPGYKQKESAKEGRKRERKKGVKKMRERKMQTLLRYATIYTVVRSVREFSKYSFWDLQLASISH